MSAITLFIVLLTLAYTGSVAAGGRAIRGFGLPSGAEYVVLGFALGPGALGVIERSTMTLFEPLAVVGLAWLALVVGVDYGYVDGRKVRAGRVGLGALAATSAGLAGAGAAYAVGLRLTELRGAELAVLVIGAGAVTSETTRQAVRWVVERRGASGPLSTLFADLSDSGDGVPILALALLFAVAGPSEPATLFGPAALTVAGLVVGALLGATAALLLRREHEAREAWGVVLGTALLAIGSAARFGMPALPTAFIMGVTLSALSRHGDELRRMLGGTERSVLLPMLLIAGASVNLHASKALIPLVGAAVAARVVVKLAMGAALRRSIAAASGASRLLGLGSLPAGPLTMCVGLAIQLRFPGEAGDAALVLAAAVTIIGELFGPTALERELARAGEVGAATQAETETVT